jgi:UDP-glucose 4-epimerase
MTNGKILVTGGAGFIGSHTVVELIKKGYEVIIVDDLSNSHEEVISAIKKITGVLPLFIKADLTDRDKTVEIFQQYSPAAVIHFAAKKMVGESVEKPLLYYRTNLDSLMNVIECCIEFNCSKLVFSSSCTVYGQPDELPVKETTPLKSAESPYGNTKKISEDILSDVAQSSPLRVIALRYFNPVGAHDSALIGEYPIGAPGNLMPILTQTAIGKRQSFSIFGDDYNTPDGTCIRDYIHVVDLADAHVMAITRLENIDANYEVFNIGTGNGISVLEMVKSFEKVNSIKLNYTISERRKGDIEKVWADTKKANELLGWKALKTLPEMVSSAWAWEKQLASIQNKLSEKI